ncbi:hypothetical protein TIFTF001_043810 [Ficus carica]|uniref:Uncharacterized protein n=1 Tax=Ficus carica TaxID=3494 RepID=A0AA87YWQ8_FICCA|nr:hypothetical protein TIFTF001_043810 [Ficus carica]
MGSSTEPEWLFSTGTQTKWDKKNEESVNESQASNSRLAREGERSCLGQMIGKLGQVEEEKAAEARASLSIVYPQQERQTRLPSAASSSGADSAQPFIPKGTSCPTGDAPQIHFERLLSSKIRIFCNRPANVLKFSSTGLSHADFDSLGKEFAKEQWYTGRCVLSSNFKRNLTGSKGGPTVSEAKQTAFLMVGEGKAGRGGGSRSLTYTELLKSEGRAERLSLVDFSFDLSYRPVDPSKQAISDKSDDPHSLLFYVLQVGKKGLWHLVHSFLWQRKGRKQAIRTEERGLERIRYVEREPRIGCLSRMIGQMKGELSGEASGFDSGRLKLEREFVASVPFIHWI